MSKTPLAAMMRKAAAQQRGKRNAKVLRQLRTPAPEPPPANDDLNTKMRDAWKASKK